MESSQSCAATLTHYSTELLTTGPDYDPLLLLLALAGDVHPNPGPSSYPCSVCFKNVTSQGTSYLCTRCSHWVHSRCSGLRNAADYRKANGWICTACMTPPQSRAPPPPPTPAHMPTISDKTFNILQWNANGIGSKQTELSIFLEAHNVKVAAIQESKLTAKSRSPNIQNYTLLRQDRRLGPGGRKMADSINGSDYGILNWDSPTRVPQKSEPSSPDVSLASASLITSCSWQTLSTLSSDHLPILIRLQMKSPSNPGLRRTYVNLKKANWDRYRQEVEAALSKRSLPTDCQRDEKIFRTILLKAASHHIPTGRHRLHEEPVPAEILDVMNRRDDLRKRYPTSPELPRMNKDIQNRICVHKRQKWRDFVETMDQKTDVTKLWRTIKGIDGRAKREAENVAITFNGISFSSSKQLATKFNQQFNTSKLGRHTSSRETRVVTREAKRKSLEMAQSFTSDLVMKAIKSCRNSKAFGPDKLSIFHLKHLGPRAIEYITALFNLSVTTCQIPAIWKSSLIIPIPKPGKDTSQGTSYRPISLLCPAAKVMESAFTNSQQISAPCSRPTRFQT